MTAPLQIDLKGNDVLTAALTAFPEDDERHWEVQAYLFNLLAHKAQSRADAIRRDRQAELSRPNPPAKEPK